MFLLSLKVYEQNEGIQEIISEPICGSDIPSVMYSSKKSIMVNFQSDAFSDGTGFRATYKAIRNGLFILIVKSN